MTGINAICAVCKTPLDFKDDKQSLLCPTCGATGSIEEVRAEVQSHIDETHARMLQHKVEDFGKAYPWTDPTITPLQGVSRRFISDLTPDNYAAKMEAAETIKRA